MVFGDHKLYTCNNMAYSSFKYLIISLDEWPTYWLKRNLAYPVNPILPRFRNTMYV